VDQGAACAVCGERDPVVLGPHELGSGETVIVCRNDAARARRRPVTLEDLRREHAARVAASAA
jgi:hypothetical protein